LASISIVQHALGLVIHTAWSGLARIEVHGGFDDDLLVRIARGLQRELVAVRDGAAVALDELDDLAAHVEVRHEQQRVAEVLERRLRVLVEPREHGARLAVGQAHVLLGVGLELRLVPVERQIGLADVDVRIEADAGAGGRQGSGGHGCGRER
jgi:hypothetical protein